MSVALQIRDVPEPVRDALAARARAQGKSLQSYLLKLVEEDARRTRNVDLINAFENRADGYSGDEDTADMVREMRAEREVRLSDGSSAQ
ncbi:hypothetical protein ABGB14_12770 [Nonomuraea sp. B10E15]|uniref:FitA-like ribbon-helix-helix domain-containing protein n=1 Tax=Nonomuraea sp. B10E15 TaxID=3153560 RepID=UPI00325E6939